MSESRHQLLTRGMFSVREILKFTSLYLIILLFLNGFRQIVTSFFPKADTGRLFFPISVGIIRIPEPILTRLANIHSVFLSDRLNEVASHSLHWGIAIISVFAFYMTYPKITKNKENVLFIYVTLAFSIIISNSIQGIYQGFIYPLAGLRNGMKTHYYQDAERFDSVLQFLSSFNSVQTDLYMHSPTHPPGAVMIYQLLQEIMLDPIFVGMIIMLVSLLSVYYIYNLLLAIYDKRVAFLITLVFGFLPTIQVYFYSSLDALILFFATGGFYYYYWWESERSTKHFILLIFNLIMLSMLNFMWVILPLIFAFHKLHTMESLSQPIKDGIKVATPIILFFVIIDLVFNFNYVEAFNTASGIVNNGGFYAFTNPVSYVFTRFENVIEIFVFLGPFVTLLIYRGLREPSNDIVNFTWYMALAVLLVFIAGTPPTAETARNMQYIIPFLLLPVADYIYNKDIDYASGGQLVFLLWIQTISMQLFGNFLW